MTNYLWIITLLFLVAKCEGILPASASSLDQSPISADRSMRTDLILHSCGLTDSHLNRELLWPCKLPVALPIEDDKMRELPLVCYAFQDMALRWCEKERKIDDIFNLSSTSDSCLPGNDSLRVVLINSNSDYYQTRPYVDALVSALENQTLCRHICFSVSGKPEPLCSIVLNGNREIASGHLVQAVVEAKPQSVKDPIPVVYSPPQLPTNSRVKETKVIQQEAPQIPKTDTIKLKDEVNLPVPPKEVKNIVSVEQPVSYIPPDIKNVKSENLDAAATGIKHISEIANQPTRESTAVKNPPQVEDKVIQSPIEQIKADENDYNFDGSDDGMDEADGNSMINAGYKSTSQSKHFSVQETQVASKVEILPENMSGAYPVVPFSDAEDSNFFTYFLFAIGIFILGYVVYHNKNKVLGLLVEGRRNSNTGRRRGVSSSTAYRKLDCTLEEAVSSTPPSHGPNIVY